MNNITVTNVENDLAEFEFNGRAFMLDLMGNIYGSRKGGEYKKLSTNIVSGKPTILLSSKGMKLSAPIDKLMMLCFKSEERDRSWIIKRIDGNSENCALANLRWESLKNVHKSYAMEIDQAIKIYKSESPEAAGKYLQDVVGNIIAKMEEQ